MPCEAIWGVFRERTVTMAKLDEVHLKKVKKNPCYSNHSPIPITSHDAATFFTDGLRAESSMRLVRLKKRL